MVYWNGGAYMVKDGFFFDAQENGPWKEGWRSIFADSIEHARCMAKLQWGMKGEKW